MISSIEQIIGLPEGRRIEFKEDIGTGIEIIKTVIAFSNGAGGDIFIGIKDNPREITGIDEKQLINKEEKLANLISDLCIPVIIPDIGVFENKGKLVLRIHIYPGSHLPYYFKKEGKNQGTYIRIGSTNRKADKSIIDEMERRRQNRSFDAEPVHNIAPEEIDLDDFAQFYKNKTNKPITPTALKNISLITKESNALLPTNAAVLLSKQPLKSKYFPYAKIECARFKGTDMSVFLDQFSSTLSVILQPEEVIAFIRRNIARGSTFEGIYRKDRWEYPLVAIREALI